MMSQRKRAEVSVSVHFLTQPCKWEVDTSRAGKVRFVMQPGDPKASRAILDAWKVRDTFLSLKNEKKFLAFLRASGRFTSHTLAESWSLEELQSWQEVIRSIATIHPEKWTGIIHEHFDHLADSELVSKFDPRFGVAFGKHGKLYTGEIDAMTTLRAMIACTYIDHVAGLKIGFCARPDCRKIFEIKTRHRKIYCSHACGHYQTMRRLRANKKPSKKTA